MIGSDTTPPFRIISVVALFQVAVVVAGTLFVCAMLKAYGYKSGMLPDNAFSPAARFVRHWGIVVLVIPAAWACLSILTTRTGARRGFLILVLLGIAAVFAGAYWYLSLGVTRPGLIQIAP